nr:MAG TPA: hypothetical protein [Caudoviricetes sp.]
MKRPITTNACYLGSMLLGVGALLCASGIENSTNGWAMLGWTMIALALGGVALILAALGISAGQPAPKRRNSPYGRIDRTHARTHEPDYRQDRRDA